MSDTRIGRLQRKLDQRNRRIAGMQRYIADLEHQLATKDLQVRRLPVEVTRAVQEALCNVRMIPVLGVGGSTRIVETRAIDPKEPK
jgi:hypothetical protein